MWDTIITILAPLVTLAILLVSGFLVNFLQKKAKESQASANKNIGDFIISFLSSSAATIVDELNQTVVDDIKKKSEDGKLTVDEAAQIKDLAVSKLIDSIPSTLWDNLNKLYDGEVDGILGSFIESAVSQNKVTNLSVLTTEAKTEETSTDEAKSE